MDMLIVEQAVQALAALNGAKPVAQASAACLPGKKSRAVSHYVEDVPKNTLSAMNLLESLFNERSTSVAMRAN